MCTVCTSCFLVLKNSGYFKKQYEVLAYLYDAEFGSLHCLPVLLYFMLIKLIVG